MARPKDSSLKYYNQDTKDDDNLQYIEAQHGLTGYAIVHKLWKHIYGGPDGYFCQWSIINKSLFCKNNGITVDELDKVLETCFTVGIEIFNRKMSEENGILTSKGIQKRWHKIIKECGRKGQKIKDEYLLITIFTEKQEETTPTVLLSGEETTPTVLLNSTGTPQSKVNKSKVKENCVLGEHTQNVSAKLDEGKTSEKGMLAGKIFVPPSYDDVKQYFFDKLKGTTSKIEPGLIAQKFFNHYKGTGDDAGWKTKHGQLITNWKAKANQWLLDDLNGQQKSKSNAPPKKKENVARGTLEDNEIGFIESIYAEWLEGTMKEENIPVGVYKMLVNAKAIMLNEDEKTTILVNADNDERKAAQSAIAQHFNKLKANNRESVFEMVK